MQTKNTQLALFKFFIILWLYATYLNTNLIKMYKMKNPQFVVEVFL